MRRRHRIEAYAMPKMPIDQFLAEIRKCQDDLLGTSGVSHEVVGDRVHLTGKDDLDGDFEVWVYPNDDGSFTYSRGEYVEIRQSVEDLVEAVYGNEPGETY